MSYQTAKLGTSDVLLSYRYIAVAKGAAKPTPAAGYTISGPIDFGDPAHDWYMEHKTTVGAIAPA